MLNFIRFSLLCLAISLTLTASAQTNQYLPVLLPSTQPMADAVAQLVDERIVLEPNKALWAKLLQDRPTNLKIALPAPDGSTWNIALTAYEPATKGFTVTTNNAAGKKEVVDVFPGLHYQGTFEDGRKGLVAISILNEEWMGVISFGTGNYVLGRLGATGTTHILYNDASLKAKSPFLCGYKDAEHVAITEAQIESGKRGGTSNCVSIYVEAGFRVYEEKNSNLTTTTQWVTGLFNVVSQVYANDQISLRMSELFVNTSIDQYYNYDLAENTLYDFADNNLSVNGDLAHYVTLNAPWTDAGGIAALDGLCNGYGYGTSNLDNTFANLPTYSWSINVVTHELGHNLGSEHTHSCNWPGGPIDTCYTVEGNCYNGPDRPKVGTIMSYCHLGGSVNLNLGLGPLPAGFIRNTISNAWCLAQITDPTSITPNGSSVVSCPGQGVVLTVNGGDAGTGSRWAWYAGACGTALVGTGRTITVSPSTTTQYFARGEGCGNTSCLSITVTMGTSSVPPTAINAVSSTICSGTNTDLSITGGQLASGAQWEWFADICGLNAAGTGSSINVSPTVSTTYQVRASSGCGTNNCVSIPITVIETPNIAITPNDTTITPGGCVTLTATGGSTFAWSTGETSNSIEVCETLVDEYTYRVTVTNNGDCGISKSVKVTFANPSGINDVANSSINIYPNPTAGAFAIGLSQPFGQAQVVMLDMLGRVVYAQPHTIANGQIDVTPSLANGMYVVKVETGNTTAFKKVLVAQ